MTDAQAEAVGAQRRVEALSAALQEAIVTRTTAISRLLASGTSQHEAARLLGISQPRIVQIMKQKPR